jgi:secondary thiamine-phosphate synthase enzyme
MKVYSENVEFETHGEFDVRDITPWIQGVVRRSGVKEGLLLVYAGHATGVIILNEYDPSLIEDLKTLLRRLTPTEADYQHPLNAFAHLRSILMEPSKVIPIHGGRLGLGRWQRLYWVEAETRPRRRRVEATAIGE